MTWKVETALALLAGPSRSLGSWLVELGRQKAGLAMLVTALGGGIGIGASGVVFFSDFRTWGPRIAAMEDRLDTHVAEVSEPGIARIERLERRQEDFREQWDREWDLDGGGRLAVQAEMIRQLYCSEWPDRCERVPRQQQEDSP